MEQYQTHAEGHDVGEDCSALAEGAAFVRGYAGDDVSANVIPPGPDLADHSSTYT